MSLGIILSQPCVNAYLKRLKPVQKVASPDNGQQEKPKCLPKHTKQQVEDTVDRCETCECYECDCEECNCECHTEKKNEEVQGVPV